MLAGVPSGPKAAVAAGHIEAALHQGQHHPDSELIWSTRAPVTASASAAPFRPSIMYSIMDASERARSLPVASESRATLNSIKVY